MTHKEHAGPELKPGKQVLALWRKRWLKARIVRQVTPLLFEVSEYTGKNLNSVWVVTNEEVKPDVGGGQASVKLEGGESSAQCQEFLARAVYIAKNNNTPKMIAKLLQRRAGCEGVTARQLVTWNEDTLPGLKMASRLKAGTNLNYEYRREDRKEEERQPDEGREGEEEEEKKKKIVAVCGAKKGAALPSLIQDCTFTHTDYTRTFSSEHTVHCELQPLGLHEVLNLLHRVIRVVADEEDEATGGCCGEPCDEGHD
jgi:hypothetical protein